MTALKQMKACGLALGLACALTGCATVEMSSAGAMKNGDRLLVIQNDGYELLWCIPIGSGALTWSEARQKVNCEIAPFTNHSDTQHLYAMALKIAQREKCDLVDVAFIDNYLAYNTMHCYGIFKCNDTAISAILRPQAARETNKEVK